MSEQYLKTALNSLNYNEIVQYIINEEDYLNKIEAVNEKLALWAKQFEVVDKNNPALAFIREMQNAGHYVAILLALSLYKPAICSMRTMFESALYYSYYRTHPIELAALVRDKSYLLKKEILEYHSQYTEKYSEKASCFGLVDKINSWYGNVSSVVHGQIPGDFNVFANLEDLKYDKNLLEKTLKYFKDGEEIIHYFFLCTIDKNMWQGFFHKTKEKLLKGIPAAKKKILAL